MLGRFWRLLGRDVPPEVPELAELDSLFDSADTVVIRPLSIWLFKLDSWTA
jgi:hypothetical protein